MQEYTQEFKDVLFRTPTELEKSGGVWVVRIGRNVAKPDYHVGPRMIPYYSLHFVLQGTVQLTYDNHSFLLRQGDAFCLFPDVPYQYSSVVATEPLRLFWVALNGPQVSPLVKRHRLTRETPFGKGVFRHNLEPLLMELMSVYDRSLRHQEEDLRLLALLYRVFALMESPDGRLTGSHEEGSSNHWIRRSKQFMDLHYTEPITIGDVADYTAVHRTQLHKCFVDRFGCSPMHYLQKLRLEKGTRLLRETSCSVSVIALSVGYPDLCSFSRAYRKFYGRSPSEYRKEMG